MRPRKQRCFPKQMSTVLEISSVLWIYTMQDWNYVTHYQDCGYHCFSQDSLPTIVTSPWRAGGVVGASVLAIQREYSVAVVHFLLHSSS